MEDHDDERDPNWMVGADLVKVLDARDDHPYQDWLTKRERDRLRFLRWLIRTGQLTP